MQNNVACVFSKKQKSTEKTRTTYGNMLYENGHSIQARKVIFAAGYETLEVKQEKSVTR